ncbi:MAG: adenylyl-sulfate kinase [Pseudohongiellaceae bacterium]
MNHSSGNQFRAKLISTEAEKVTLEPLNGELNLGDALIFCNSGELHSVQSVQSFEGQLSVSLDAALSRSDLSVAEIVANADSRPDAVDQFEAQVHWLAEQKMLPGRQYLLDCAGQLADATISKLKYRVDEGSEEKIAADSVSQFQTFVGNFALNRSIAIDPDTTELNTSRFLLRNESGEVLAKGNIRHSLRRASNVHWQAVSVDKSARSKLKNQKPKIVWLTGLSASGKSTIANVVEKKLLAMGKHAYLLDGDNVRHGLNKDLGFTDADRVENIRRIAETSKLMLDAGLIVIASFISPFDAERQMARSLFTTGEFIEVHVDASLALCEQRDPKGLYKKVRQGLIQNFTGFDSPYEKPNNPEIRIDTAVNSAEEAGTQIVEYLLGK